uniref:Uncharacterized protein n=1 Tax=Trichinella nativa TaxID=6335 RepID=A0A0V1JUJ4_9BILA
MDATTKATLIRTTFSWGWLTGRHSAEGAESSTSSEGC